MGSEYQRREDHLMDVRVVRKVVYESEQEHAVVVRDKMADVHSDRIVGGTAIEVVEAGCSSMDVAGVGSVVGVDKVDCRAIWEPDLKY
jgi:hypothetical protein